MHLSVPTGHGERCHPRDELSDYVENLARKIAEKPSFGLKITKEAINQTQDTQGLWNAQQAVFIMHTLAHLT